MAVREPAWFRAVPFSREVIYFSLTELEWFPPFRRLHRFPKEFREAVRTVGTAVYCLQLIMRNRLRPLFVESINMISRAVEGRVFYEMLAFMTQHYLHGDVFNFTVTYFAIVGELILFMEFLEIPIPEHFYPMPWCAIYEHRLKNELASNGGWGKLLEVVDRRYTASGLYHEISTALSMGNPIPHAEVSTLNNLPRNPFNFMHERFPVAPRNTVLALQILENLYREDDDVDPEPRDGAHAVRLMLELQHMQAQEGDHQA